MNWLFLSLACAFFTATTATLSKIILKKLDELVVLWIIYAFSLPLVLIALIQHPVPHLSSAFWATLLVLLPLETTAFLMYLRALKLSPLSLTFPFLGLTPLFTILTSSIILGERFSLSGIGGVVLVSAGAYVLNFNTAKEGFCSPIKNIYKEKGSMIMILVAFIYSFTSVLGKRAVLLSSPMVFPGIYYSIFFVILTPLAYLAEGSLEILPRFARQDEGSDKGENTPTPHLNMIRFHRPLGFDGKIGGQANFKLGKKDMYLFFGVGITFAAAILLHFQAISLVNVSYMISVKRLSLIVSVLYGAIVFKEKNIGYRMLGSLIMLLGVVILSLIA